MTREECQEKLIDLLYGELAEPEAEQVRAALREYPDVEASWQKLQQGHQLSMYLPMPEPAASIDERILAAARAKAAGEEPAAVARAAEETEDEGLWASILRWVGGFAMGPQVAMATIMLLVVAIGLWYLPGSEPTPEQQASGGTVVTPPDHSELGPSQIAPAEPLALDLDPRAGRITARDGEEEADLDLQAGAAPPSGRRAQNRAVPQRGGDVVEGAIAQADDDLGLADAPAPAATARAAGLGTTSGDRAAYDRGLERYRRGDFAGAAEDLDQVVQRPSGDARQLVPEALYTLARSHERNGNCAGAIQQYQRLLTQYPAYGQAPQARLRMAECYRRLGRLSEARAALEQARQHQSTREEAQRELLRLDQMDRAMRRPARRMADEAPAAAAESFDAYE